MEQAVRMRWCGEVSARRGGKRSMRAASVAACTHSHWSGRHWPISVGIIPVILLSLSSLSRVDMRTGRWSAREELMVRAVVMRW